MRPAGLGPRQTADTTSPISSRAIPLARFTNRPTLKTDQPVKLGAIIGRDLPHRWSANCRTGRAELIKGMPAHRAAMGADAGQGLSNAIAPGGDCSATNTEANRMPVAQKSRILSHTNPPTWQKTILRNGRSTFDRPFSATSFLQSQTTVKSN